MTKQYDPKLVEAVGTAVAVAWSKWVATENKGADERLEDWLGRAATTAIDASGIAFVAPWELTPALAKRGAAMVLDTQMASGHPERGGTFNDFELPMAVAWRSVRDACLAERRGEGR